MMITNQRSICVFAITLSFAVIPVAFAQTESPANTPEGVVEIYCKAITTNNSELLLPVIHEASGKHLGDLILESIKELQRDGEITLSHQLFGRTLTEGEIAALTWRDALGRFLCGPTANAKPRRFRSSSWGLDPNWMGGLNAHGTRRVVGTVDDEGEIQMAHVVYRYEGMNPRPHEDFVNVLTCHKDDERWEIVLPWKMQIAFLHRAATLKMTSKHRMQPSGEAERFEVDDQPSPPADR